MGMGACTKTNGFKVIIVGLVLFIILNFVFNLLSGKHYETFSFSSLSAKRFISQRGHTRRVVTEIFTPSSNSSSNEQKYNSQEVNSTIFEELIETNANEDDRQYLEQKKIPEQTNGIPVCKDIKPGEGGPIVPNITLESLDLVQQRLASTVMMGGWYRPINCSAKYHVAIIVPFRDRYAQLTIFLKNLHPFLMKQNIEYRIFVMEQTNGKSFNRAALMNVGFLEASKKFTWDCFIFHDVDLLPLDDRNIYSCPNQPRHMSVAVDVFGYRLPYNSIFGGVSAMTRKHFIKVNGFSNSFWGWGAEDDDMSNRIQHAKLYISRYPINIARYMMLPHPKERANPKRYENLVNGVNKFNSDGLNSIRYEIYSFKDYPLFTWYLVELKITDQR